MATTDLRPHPPSARSAPTKRTKLSTVAQLRDVLRLGCVDEISEVVISECGPSTLSGELVLRVLSLPSITTALRVLDLSFNGLSDTFWTETDWSKAPRWPALTNINLANNGFTEACVPVLRDVLTRCPTLQQLDLAINAFGYKLVERDPALDFDISSIFSSGLSAIECLDLSCLHVSDVQLTVLLDTPILMRSLARLYLRSNDLTDNSAIAIADALAAHRFPVLKVLSLAGNTIGDAGLGALAFALEDAAALEVLDVHENQISDAGLRTLFHVVNGLDRLFSVRFIHLTRRKGTRQTPQLVDMIQLKLQEKILETHVASTASKEANVDDPIDFERRCLCLNGKTIRSKLLMASVLTDHFVSVALTAIRHCAVTWTAVEELDLSGNAIGTPGACELGSFLSLLPPKLRLLNIANNDINDEGVVGLAEGLEWNATLTELNLNENRITDDGAKQLYLKAFTSNLQRKILLSEGNPLTSECKVMVAAISQAYDLRKRFIKEFAPLEKLDFEGQKLRQYGAAAVAECLLTISASKCTSLDLSNNMLGDEGAVEVARMLRGYAPLTRLDLSFNDIGDTGAVALADALRVNATLTSFSLHSSIAGSSTAKPKLTETGLIAIARSLEKHKALTSLDLRDNVMPAALIPALVQTLQRNPRIQKFNGSSAAVFLSRNDM